MNDSMMSSNSLAIEEDEYIGLIQDLNIEDINRQVFDLYQISYGLDTTLALRKV